MHAVSYIQYQYSQLWESVCGQTLSQWSSESQANNQCLPTQTKAVHLSQKVWPNQWQSWVQKDFPSETLTMLFPIILSINVDKGRLVNICWWNMLKSLGAWVNTILQLVVSFGLWTNEPGWKKGRGSLKYLSMIALNLSLVAALLLRGVGEGVG